MKKIISLAFVSCLLTISACAQESENSSSFHKFLSRIQRTQYKDVGGNWSDPIDKVNMEAILIDFSEKKAIGLSTKQDFELKIVEQKETEKKGDFIIYTWACTDSNLRDCIMKYVFNETEQKNFYLSIEYTNVKFLYFID
ncbi:MAG: hypothetical protein ABI405_04950 [Parafilimonas sp.]